MIHFFVGLSKDSRLAKPFMKGSIRKRIMQSARLFSYKHFPGKCSLAYKTVGKLLDESAERFGDRTAYVSVYQGKRVSFGEVKEKADAFAAGVLECGIERGDRVGLWAPNSFEWYLTSLALARAGIISVYLNPLYQSNEIKHCLNAVGVKMLVTAEKYKNQNYMEILNEIAPEISKSGNGKLKIKNLPSIEWIVCTSDANIPGVIPYKYITESATTASRRKLEAIKKVLNPDDAVNIQFTSGTTGAPKGAVLSHFHIVNNSFFISQRQGFHERNHIMCFMGPLFHAMGSSIGILTCLHEGVVLVVPEAAFSPSKAVAAILNENCTVLLGTPTMYVDVLKIIREKGSKIQTLEVAITGGAFAPKQLFIDIMEKLGARRVASVYGLTESGPVAFMSNITDDLEKSTATVGSLMDHVEAKVVDEQGHILPWNTPGELWIRGYNVMKGYWGNEKKTKETLTCDQWLKTGDQFSLSEDGYGKIVGRIKDLIIRGGENIFPADIEEFLSTHPEVLEVQVVGIPDKRLGEQVCACIRLKPNKALSQEDIKEYCKGKIASFKIPHYVYFVENFPKTTSGKVQKFVLRRQAIEYLQPMEGNC